MNGNAITADREITITRVFDAPRDLVTKEYGAIEGGRQALERLAEFLAPA